MTQPRWQLVSAAVLLTLVAVGFALLVTESAAGAAVAAGAVWLSLWAHLALHEGAHLVAALLLRIPVVAVRVAPFGGWRNEVVTRPSPSASGLPVRMVLVHLAGPLANLGTAAALGVWAVAPGPASVRVALFVAAAVAVMLGLGNLVPWHLPPTDGTKAVLWLARSEEIRAQIRLIHFQEEVSRTLRALNPGDVDPALAAFIARCDTAFLPRQEDFMAEAVRLQALAHAEGTAPEVAAAIGRTLTVQFGLWYLYAAAVTRSPVEHKEIVELAELAAVAGDRLALGLVAVLDERPAEALSLLSGLFGDDVALALRAVAGCQAGDRAEADRLLAGGGRHYEQLATVVAAVRDADPVRPMSLRDPQSTPRRHGPLIAAVNPLPTADVP
jgi:hypothetical protein